MVKGKTPRWSRSAWKERLSKLRPHWPKYLADSFNEIKKVTWPSRREAWRLTLAVFIFSGVFMVLILLVDSLFKVIAEELFL